MALSIKVRILKIDESQITEVDRLELDGHYKSRLIGDKLYLVPKNGRKIKSSTMVGNFPTLPICKPLN